MLRQGWVAALGVILSLAGCASAPPAPPPKAAETNDFGVLVMAHGGTAEWNQGVLDTVSPLRARYPVELAFGMADAKTLQAGVRALEAAGVRKIAVVRLFVSGDSWFERTQQILGLRDGAPAAGAVVDAAAAHPTDAHAAKVPDPHAAHAANPHAGHSMAFFRIQSQSTFALSTEGLANAPGMGNVLADRAMALSKQPELEDVLVLAHGPADDAENERWLTHLDQRAESIRARAPFRRVQVATLREDWPDKRAVAERDIRAFVERAAAEGGKAIVIPFRVHGFGPYASVLHGLDYVADGHGLIPHPEVSRWLNEQINLLESAQFQPQVAR